MNQTCYTHAQWHVLAGREDEFISAWHELSATFAKLHGKPLWGSLLQSVSEPTLFYSFGPWQSVQDIEAMRTDPSVQQALDKVRALCRQATPGAYRLVAHVTLTEGTEAGAGQNG